MKRAPKEFARVVSCDRCSRAGYPKLLRDDSFNLPQPGYVGSNYANAKVLLVGQNPGVSRDRFSVQDREFADAQIALRDNANTRSYRALKSINDRIMPTWPVVTRQFPLDECGLQLNDIAYINAVRCRTSGDTAPGKDITQACVDDHFVRWLDWLEPRVVVCIGKWAHDRVADLLEVRCIPHGFVNRHRSLSRVGRQENRMRVVSLVRRVVGGKCQEPVLPKVGTPARLSPSRPADATRAIVESSPKGLNIVAVDEYIEMFADLGFNRKEKPNDSKPLKHKGMLLPSLYFNLNKDGVVYFVGYKNDDQRYPAHLWKRLPPQKGKDNKPNLVTIVPKVGREREAFMELLSPTR